MSEPSSEQMYKYACYYTWCSIAIKANTAFISPRNNSLLFVSLSLTIMEQYLSRNRRNFYQVMLCVLHLIQSFNIKTFCLVFSSSLAIITCYFSSIQLKRKNSKFQFSKYREKRRRNKESDTRKYRALGHSHPEWSHLRVPSTDRFKCSSHISFDSGIEGINLCKLACLVPCRTIHFLGFFVP